MENNGKNVLSIVAIIISLAALAMSLITFTFVKNGTGGSVAESNISVRQLAGEWSCDELQMWISKNGEIKAARYYNNTNGGRSDKLWVVATGTIEGDKIVLTKVGLLGQENELTLDEYISLGLGDFTRAYYIEPSGNSLTLKPVNPEETSRLFDRHTTPTFIKVGK